MAGSEVESQITTTASWRPMAFGDGDPMRIADPVFEPRWVGRRALIELAGGLVTIREVDLGMRPRTADLQAAVAAACLADEALLDGYLIPGVLPAIDAPPRPSSSTAAVTRGGILRHLFLGSLVRSRRPAGRDEGDTRVVALPPDGPIAYVAIDLLWLDGQPLIDLPLGERKRLLEAVLSDGELVRRTPAVRAPAERWHGQWRALGFEDMAVRGANSRYLPGDQSRDWTIIPIPRS